MLTPCHWRTLERKFKGGQTNIWNSQFHLQIFSWSLSSSHQGGARTHNITIFEIYLEFLDLLNGLGPIFQHISYNFLLNILQMVIVLLDQSANQSMLSWYTLQWKPLVCFRMPFFCSKHGNTLDTSEKWRIIKWIPKRKPCQWKSLSF